MCDALVEGILASSREEMPQALACFRTVFPAFVQSLPAKERAARFTAVFEVKSGADIYCYCSSRPLITAAPAPAPARASARRPFFHLEGPHVVRSSLLFF